MAATTRRRDDSGRVAHDGAVWSVHDHRHAHGPGRAPFGASPSAPHTEVTR